MKKELLLACGGVGLMIGGGYIIYRAWKSYFQGPKENDYNPRGGSIYAEQEEKDAESNSDTSVHSEDYQADESEDNYDSDIDLDDFFGHYGSMSEASGEIGDYTEGGQSLEESNSLNSILSAEMVDESQSSDESSSSLTSILSADMVD